MPLFNWSTAHLPNPTNAYGMDINPAVARTIMDSGRARQLRLFTTTDRSAKVTWRLTDAEWALFQGIVEHKLDLGASWFLIDLPTGKGMEQVTARFAKGRLTARQVPVLNWDVSAELDIKGASPLSAAEVDAILAAS